VVAPSLSLSPRTRVVHRSRRKRKRDPRLNDSVSLCDRDNFDDDGDYTTFYRCVGLKFMFLVVKRPKFDRIPSCLFEFVFFIEFVVCIEAQLEAIALHNKTTARTPYNVQNIVARHGTGIE
jgi:hypothetical protein